MLLLNPEHLPATPQRARNLRAANANTSGCLQFDPADGPRFLVARPDDIALDALEPPVRQLPRSARAKTTPTTEVSDEVLAKRCRTELPHTLTAYEELVRRHEARVFNTCIAMINSRSDAEEVCQDVFVQVFRKIHQFEGRSSFKTWLFRIAYNMCLSRRAALARRREREAKIAEAIDIRESADLADIGIGELSESIQEALGRLDEQKRLIVALKFVSGLSIPEIATHLDLKLSATKMRFYRALDEFKAAYLEVAGENLAT